MENKAKPLLDDLKEKLVRVYGERLQGMRLYGSYARGEEDPESDVDVLIILDRIPQYGAEIERTGSIISELSLKYGVSISRVFVSRDDWASSQSPFIMNAREEAIPV